VIRGSAAVTNCDWPNSDLGNAGDAQIMKTSGGRAVAVAFINLRLTLAVLSFAASLAADAQPTSKIYRIGYLSTGSASTTYTRPLEAFRQGLRELGWVEGRNLYIEYRFAEGRVDRLPALADELVRLKVDVIVASPTPSALAARNATRTIPIVGMSLTEPVAVGLVASLAHPGGNVTGLTYGVDTEIFGKQLQLLKEFIPNVRRVAVLSNPGSSPAQPLVLESVRSAARSLGVPLQTLEVREPNDFEPAFAAMVKEHADALLLSGDPMFFPPPRPARQPRVEKPAAVDVHAVAMGGSRGSSIVRAQLPRSVAAWRDLRRQDSQGRQAR
jgi:ABC-type uncharacterized transport system substrate-binding protein